jgi:hypothetical protein
MECVVQVVQRRKRIKVEPQQAHNLFAVEPVIWRHGENLD